MIREGQGTSIRLGRCRPPYASRRVAMHARKCYSYSYLQSLMITISVHLQVVVWFTRHTCGRDGMHAFPIALSKHDTSTSHARAHDTT